jgi:hypothetical protein
MAKCPVCNTRKGKRQCQIHERVAICSLCCGQIREEYSCQGCGYYQDPRSTRKYHTLPSYPMHEMERAELSDSSLVIESGFCRFDDSLDQPLRDQQIAGIIQGLLSKYHFEDESIHLDNDDITQQGFKFLDQRIQQHLPNISNERLVKLIGCIYGSVRRRTKGRREYLDFVYPFANML